LSRLRFTSTRNSRARVKFFTSRGNSAVFRGIHVPVYIRYMPVYIRQNTQIYGKYRGFGELLGLLGGVVPLCSLCPLRVVFCVVRASFSINSYSHLSFFAVSCSSSLVTRFAGGDLHNHGAGLSAGRGNDVSVSGLVDVERFANGLCVEGILLDIIHHSARSRRDGLNTWVN